MVRTPLNVITRGHKGSAYKLQNRPIVSESASASINIKSNRKIKRRLDIQFVFRVGQEATLLA